MRTRENLIEGIISRELHRYMPRNTNPEVTTSKSLVRVALSRDTAAMMDRLAGMTEEELGRQFDLADFQSRRLPPKAFKPAHDQPRGKVVKRAYRALKAISEEYGEDLPFSTKELHRKVGEWLKQAGLETVSPRSTERALNFFRKER